MYEAFSLEAWNDGYVYIPIAENEEFIRLFNATKGVIAGEFYKRGVRKALPFRICERISKGIVPEDYRVRYTSDDGYSYAIQNENKRILVLRYDKQSKEVLEKREYDIADLARMQSLTSL